MAPTPPVTAVLVPPLLMPAAGMLPLRWRLGRAGVRSALFHYPSYRSDIPANAARLAAFLARLGSGPFDAVTFSLGGIVLRWAASHHALPPLRRVVMIGPPNQGARLASMLDAALGPVFGIMAGASAKQLRAGAEGLCAGAGFLPADTELGIIAGGTGTPRGFNPLLGEDNDRIVRVEETRLAGMTAHTVLPLPHGPLVFAPETARLAAAFLHHGRFPAEALSSPRCPPATPAHAA